MAAPISSRLRETLGGNPQELSAEDVETLITNQVAESFDLDFKEQVKSSEVVYGF